MRTVVCCVSSTAVCPPRPTLITNRPSRVVLSNSSELSSGNLRRNRSYARDEDSWIARREVLRRLGLAVFVPWVLTGRSEISWAGLPAEVGSYMPAGEDSGFALFIPDAQKTPAIRAGTVDPNSPYRFEIPSGFREAKVANILSGNYCQPRCDEPWTEVIFEEPSSGRIALLASPLKKLTSKAEAKIEEIGPPEGLIESLGSYITGTFLDEESVVSMNQKTQPDGRTYYYYEVDSPYGTLGRHSFSVCTTKGEVAFLLVASATEKQWANSKTSLRRVTESFRA